MKKVFILLALCVPLAFVYAGGSKESPKPAADGGLRVALLINGNLGDKSFHDSANNGMAMIRDRLGCRIKVVEVGYDDSKWEPAFRDLMDEKHDIVICGTWQMQEIVSKVAPENPNQSTGDPFVTL